MTGAGVVALVLVAPKDCLLGERVAVGSSAPGPDEYSCSSIIGVEWASRTPAYLVMGAIAVLVVFGLVLLGRRRPADPSDY